MPTYNCREPDELNYVLEHLAELVVKEVHGSGGYGMLVGPDIDQGRDRSVPREDRRRSRATTSHSRRWRSRPARRLSTRALRRGIVDLRPFVLIGDQVRLMPGGLTRVALKKGSLVVNSSQGGGTKDTWVLQE